MDSTSQKGDDLKEALIRGNRRKGGWGSSPQKKTPHTSAKKRSGEEGPSK